MAKDPALLFYTSDFLTGTMTMTNDQVGKYIRLLCLQHQKTWLSEKDMLHVCGTYDQDIFFKFKKSSEGYYNERLRLEADRRKDFCESRRLSRMSHVRQTYEGRMETETVNETINVKEKKERVVRERKQFIVPAVEEVKHYCLERKNSVDAQKFVDYYTSNGWKVGKNPMKDWKAAVRTWENSDFNKPIINDGIPNEWKTKKTQYQR